jgi:hypothetical protein
VSDIDRWREVTANLSETSVPRADCPSSDTLWAAASGESSSKQTRAIGLHMAECPSCAEAWRLARAISDEELSPAVTRRGVDVSRSPTIWRLLTWPAAAAAAASLVWVVAFNLIPRPGVESGPPELRSRSGGAAPTAPVSI